MRLRTIVSMLLLLGCSVHARADTLEEGDAAVGRKDYSTAVRLLLPLAQSGNSYAQLRIGELYYHGRGVRESDAEALAWFERAALQGVAEAQYRTGNMYVYGLGMPRDDPDADRTAAQWYFEAARQGHAPAQYALAVLFLTGKGVEQDEREALKWMERAAEAGHADARRYVRARTPAR